MTTYLGTYLTYLRLRCFLRADERVTVTRSQLGAPCTVCSLSGACDGSPRSGYSFISNETIVSPNEFP